MNAKTNLFKVSKKSKRREINPSKKNKEMHLQTNPKSYKDEKKLLKRVLADFVRIRIAFIFHLLHIIYVYFDQWTMTDVITAILELY